MKYKFISSGYIADLEKAINDEAYYGWELVFLVPNPSSNHLVAVMNLYEPDDAPPDYTPS